ncbi:hypothetical protein B2J88_43445 [Rhodococcus sp. SRB_17]|nr:hypothetical protein [Rhodococcus sp. SRB_17]OYD67461.1 hypothetical protein BDB13_0984 [Rhodococcus sp. OK302]
MRRRLGNVILLLVACILVVSATIQSATGSGFGLIAGPTLILVAPQLVPAPLLILTIPMMLMVAIRERTHCDARTVGIATVTMIPGIVVGLWFLQRVDTAAVQCLVAVLALSAGAVLLSGKSVVGSRRTLAGAGAAAGFMGALAAMPGPPLSLTYRPNDAATLRSTLSTIFLVMAVATLLALELQVGITGTELLTAAVFSPLLACGHVLGSYLSRRISLSALSRATTYIIIAAATVLLAKSAVGLT